jgi:hypothetical protein
VPKYLTIRFRQRLPIIVDGGLTRWKIELSSHGKNGCKLAVYATCLNDVQQPPIKITDGRESAVQNELNNGLSAKEGTTLYKIFAKLVREERAEVVHSRNMP